MISADDTPQRGGLKPQEPAPEVTADGTDAASEPRIVGGRRFASLEKFQAFIRAFIESGAEDPPVDDIPVFMELLRSHPNAAAKLGGCGVARVIGAMHPLYNTRCLMFVRNDGTREDFSAARCAKAIWGVPWVERAAVEIPGVVIRCSVTFVPPSKPSTTSAPIAAAAGGAGAAGGAPQQQTQQQGQLEQTQQLEQPQEKVPGDAEVKSLYRLVRAELNNATGLPRGVTRFDLLSDTKPPLGLARVVDAEKAIATVEMLQPRCPISLLDPISGWGAIVSDVAVAKDKEERAFWNRRVAPRPHHQQQQQFGGANATVTADEKRREQESTLAEILRPTLQPGTMVDMATNVPPVAITPPPSLTPPPAMVVRLPAKAPRVTPTEGQNKRPATLVGTAGKPPIVTAKKPKPNSQPAMAPAHTVVAPRPVVASSVATEKK